MFAPVRHVEPVVVSQLFTGGDRALCKNPDMALNDVHFAVGVARMVDQARRIPGHIAVNVVACIEAEKVHMPRAAFAGTPHLLFCNGVAVFDRYQFADVFDHLGTLGKGLFRVHTAAVFRRIADAQGFTIIRFGGFQDAGQ